MNHSYSYKIVGFIVFSILRMDSFIFFFDIFTIRAFIGKLITILDYFFVELASPSFYQSYNSVLLFIYFNLCM